MRRIAFIIAAIIACSLSAQADSVSPERFVRDHKSGDVISAAETAISRAAQNRKDIWVLPLAEINPIRVYADRVNIVVVMKDEGKKEAGIYVTRTISSYLPTSDDEWKFTHVKNGIYLYERQKKA